MFHLNEEKIVVSIITAVSKYFEIDFFKVQNRNEGKYCRNFNLIYVQYIRINVAL
jgi:hypothetical protein